MTLAAAESAVETLLRDLLVEIRGLRSDLQRGSRERRHGSATALSRPDRALLARLLPVIGATVGSELFNSAEVVEHDAAALRLVCAGLPARSLGRLLRRAAGIPIAGYLVERVGVEAGACLWRVVHVPEFPGNEKVSVPHATGRGLA